MLQSITYPGRNFGEHKQPMTDKPTMLSVAQAAQLTGIPARTIRWNILHNRLPAQKLGEGFYIIHRHDLTQWHNNRTETQ